MKSRFLFIMILGVLIGPTSLAAETGQMAWKDTAPASRYCELAQIADKYSGTSDQKKTDSQSETASSAL